MLQSALDTVICPTAESQLSAVLPTLASVSRSNSLCGSLTGDRHDLVADWWTSLLSCAANWALNRMEESEQSYTDIDNLPTSYQVVGILVKIVVGIVVGIVLGILLGIVVGILVGIVGILVGIVGIVGINSRDSSRDSRDKY